MLQLMDLKSSSTTSQNKVVTQATKDRKKGTHLLSSVMSRAVHGIPRVIREMLLMAGLTNARHVATTDRTHTAALNLPLDQ